MRKYELTNQSINMLNNRTFYKIKALIDFGNVHSGEYGGYIEKEENLSQIGDCWIYDDSIAFGNAKVVESAVVKEKSIVSGETVMGGKSMVTGGAWVSVGHILTGNDWIKGNAINSLALCNKLYDLADSI